MDFFEEQKEIEPILTVSEFIEYVNFVIGRKKITVEGEVASYSINQNKWVFFDLKDSASKVSCFGVRYQMTVPLEDGMQVRVKGIPRVYQKSGKFSIFVESVELTGSGTLKRAFELTKAKLEKEGLFSENRKRPLALFPKALGVVASQESAAYTDFLKIIGSRWGVELFLYHCAVQGQEAESSIGKAFDWFNKKGEKMGIDTLVLIRGGGSLEDLQAFNSEAVVRAIFGSIIPVVCGVGHERDVTLADLVADVRAATPTHAAVLAVPNREELQVSMNHSISKLYSTLSHMIEWHANSLNHKTLVLEHTMHMCVSQFQDLVKRFSLQRHLFEEKILQSMNRTQEKVHRVLFCVYVLQKKTNEKFSFFERHLEQYNPLVVLKRGYGMVRKNKELISSMKALKKGDEIAVQFTDGDIKAEVL